MLKEGKSIFLDDQVQQHLNPEPAVLSDKSRAPDFSMNMDTSVSACRESNQCQTSTCNSNYKSYRKMQWGASHEIQDAKSAVFKSKLFQFSSYFPEERVSFS